ncbi:MAG: hypothetical protein HUJ68_01950 [Clostridia bacterium]|nr:hypothetical protein [Clostridia bacterium]
MAITTLKVRQGLKAELDSMVPSLESGELGFTTDEKKLYIGDGTTNIEIGGGNSNDSGTSIIVKNGGEGGIKLSDDKLFDVYNLNRLIKYNLKTNEISTFNENVPISDDERLYGVLIGQDSENSQITVRTFGKVWIRTDGPWRFQVGSAVVVNKYGELEKASSDPTRPSILIVLDKKIDNHGYLLVDYIPQQGLV